MGNVTSIPGRRANTVPSDERAEYDAFRAGEDNLREPGIDIGEGSYDQFAGSKYAKEPRPVVETTPTFATDPGQPRDISAPKIIGRQSAVERTPQTGRKAK